MGASQITTEIIKMVVSIDKKKKVSLLIIALLLLSLLAWIPSGYAQSF